MTPDRKSERQAPAGTFEDLINLPTGVLGNTRTKRWVSVTRMPDVFPAVKEHPSLTEDMAVVLIAIRDKKVGGRRYREDNYFFGITPNQELTILDSWRYDAEQGKTPVETPPTAAFLLREFSDARKAQARLKSSVG